MEGKALGAWGLLIDPLLALGFVTIYIIACIIDDVVLNFCMYVDGMWTK